MNDETKITLKMCADRANWFMIGLLCGVGVTITIGTIFVLLLTGDINYDWRL